MKKEILIFLFTIFCAAILVLSIRGISGNPNVEEFSKLNWRGEGPLELSPERSKFALLYSIVEDNSFHFSVPLARFIAPDVGFLNGKYVSLFPPGVSFFAIPGYLLGKMAGAAQVGAFATTAFFAILNVLLIRALAIRLGANQIAAIIAALVFLFATPAFSYSVTLYQHHFTVFFLLASIYTLLRWNNLASLALVWLFATTSFIFDYPNALLVLPIAIFALGRIVLFKNGDKGLSLKIKIAGLATFMTIIFPLAFLFWYNQAAYGNPLRLSQTVTGVRVIDESGNPVKPDGQTPIEPRDKNLVGFFNTRNLLNGATVHFSSLGRGIVVYAPVILFGILGFFSLYRKNPKATALLLSIIGVNFLLYSMWGDPYGGWAFGSRYLIPSYAILAIFASITLTKTVSKKALLSLIFFLLLSYSVAVNTLGALTTNSIPPKVEAVALEKISGIKEHYTYLRNWEYLMANKSKSFVYQTFAKDYLTALEYYYLIAGSIILVMGGQITYMYLKARKDPPSHEATKGKGK